MQTSILKYWLIALGASFTFIGFVLNFLDVRQWWDDNIYLFFQSIGSEPVRQSWFYQFFFWLSFILVLTSIGVLAILAQRFLVGLITDFDMRSAFSFEIDLGDFSGSSFVMSILVGMGLMILLCVGLFLIAGEFPSWADIKILLVTALGIGAFLGIFVGALCGTLGEFPQNLSFAILGIGIGAIVSIKYWDGLDFAPRIIFLGLLGATLGLPSFRTRLMWAIAIIIGLILFLISFIGIPV